MKTLADEMGEAASIDDVLQDLADRLAGERELGRQRLRALGVGEREIDAVLAVAAGMHAAQVAWVEGTALQTAGLTSSH
ncbi:MAG: hypothetical protein ABJD97_08035 [Betaproteobacteria bacterium]